MKALLASDGDLSFLDSIHYPVITIEKNTMTFISGKSGCGKSTYLRLLNRTLLPSKGRLYFEGEDVTTLPVLDYRRRVLLVPQEVFLLDATIWDNFKAFYAACDEMAPDNATMVGMGIVSLPGMMTGQILAGAVPTTAILYQIAIMIAICTVVCCACFGSLYFGSRTLYDNDTQIL